MKANQYTYNLPQDYVMQPQHRQKLDSFVIKHDLTNEEAQELVGLHVELVEEFAKEIQKAITPTVLFFVILSIVSTTVIAVGISIIF